MPPHLACSEDLRDPGNRNFRSQGGRDAQARARAHRRELRKVIVGQDEVVDQLLTALFANGHVLLVGVPGLAKTLLISSLARVLDLKFNRIQFTPDLMPSDITGTDVIEEDQATGQARVPLHPGPGVREHRARRRDQPHAAQDAGGAAPGDAGEGGHRRRPDLQAGAAVLRARHAEPDRAGGHLSAARGAARPLHVQRLRRLPDRRTRRRGSSPPRPPPTRPSSSACSAPPTSSSCRGWSAACRWPTTWCATRCGWRARRAAAKARPTS